MAAGGTKRPSRAGRAPLSAGAEQPPPGFADRVRFCARRVGSGDELARRAGIPRRTLQSYLAGGREPKVSKLVAIAEAADVPLAWLATGTPPLPVGGVDNVAPGLAEGASSAFELPAASGFALPPRGAVALSGGSLVRSPQIVDVLAFRAEWLRGLGLTAESVALLQVLGDSMRPTIGEGDLVLIDLSANAVRDNAIYALALDTAVVMKRVQLLAKSGLRLISDNPAYPPEEVAGPDAAALKVVGRVVWHGRVL